MLPSSTATVVRSAAATLLTLEDAARGAYSLITMLPPPMAASMNL
jgi:hypothetical protein